MVYYNLLDEVIPRHEGAGFIQSPSFLGALLYPFAP